MMSRQRTRARVLDVEWGFLCAEPSPLGPEKLPFEFFQVDFLRAGKLGPQFAKVRLDLDGAHEHWLFHYLTDEVSDTELKRVETGMLKYFPHSVVSFAVGGEHQNVKTRNFHHNRHAETALVTAAAHASGTLSDPGEPMTVSVRSLRFRVQGPIDGVLGEYEAEQL